MNTDLHACGCEANQNSVTMPGLKRRLQVMFLGPKKASEAISEHPSSTGSDDEGPIADTVDKLKQQYSSRSREI